ncbi:MAG: hypothetical protein JNL72_01165 [Flavipsychrobacter sp.]|nr:hypothetical protein [Flavipsychrobacter sp.]
MRSGISGGGPVPTGTGELTGYTNIVRIVNEDTVDLKRDFSTLATWEEHKQSKRVADYTMDVSDTDVQS